METNNQLNSTPSNGGFFTPKVLWTIIGVLLLVVIAASLMWWQEIKKTDQALNQQHNTCLAGTKPEDCNDDPSQTADWKTYTNSQYGFEFKYPSTSSSPKESQEEVYFTGQFGPILDCEGSDCYGYGFSVTTSPLSIFGSDALETPDRLLVYIKNNSTSADILTLISDVKQGNERIISWSSEGGIGVKFNRVDIFRPAEQRTIHIQFWNRDSDEKVFNQILSTFKFTDSSATASWTRYKEGIWEVKHPIDWTVSYGDSYVFFVPSGEKVGTMKAVSVFCGDDRSLKSRAIAGTISQKTINGINFTYFQTRMADNFIHYVYETTKSGTYCQIGSPDSMNLEKIVNTFKFTD